MAVLDPNASKLMEILMGVPEIADALRDRMVRLHTYNLIASHLGSVDDEMRIKTMDAVEKAVVAAKAAAESLQQQHTLVDCRTALVRRGYVITHPNSSAGSSSQHTLLAHSQSALMLRAFADAGPDGLTDDVAAMNSGLEGAASPWRRASTLRDMGFIAPVLDERGDIATRIGLRGSPRMISAITERGLSYLITELENH
jgi:hypothetical protein